MDGKPAPSLVLRIVSGPEAGRSLPLEPGRTVRIGRSPPPAEAGALSADLVVDDRKLSRLHCELRPVAGGWQVRDAGSSNGTFLNGERVVEKTLRAGDLIQAGSIVLELVDPLAAPPAATEAHSRARPAAGSLRRRPPKRRSPVLAGVIVLGIAAMGAIAAAVVLRGRQETKPDAPPAVATPAGRAGPPTTIDAPPAKAAAPSGPGTGASPPPGARTEVPIEVVASFLDEGDYRRALAYVDELSGRAGGVDPKPLRQSVLDRAAADLKSAEKEATRLFRSGNSAAAEPLEEIALRIPDELASEASAALERVNGLRQALHDHERKVEAGTSGVRALLARLAFADAARLVGEMATARKSAALAAEDEAPAEASEAALRREIQLAARTWKLCETAIDGRIADAKPLRISFAGAEGSGDPRAGDFRITKRERDELTLEAPGAAKKTAVRQSASLFALDDRSLKALLGAGSSGEPDSLEGLGLLLFYRAGPERASAFVRGESVLESARREALLQLFETAGDVWLPARRDAIRETARRLAAEETKGSKEPWEDLCRRIGDLVRAWRDRPGYERERAALADLFVQAKVGALKQDGLRSFFSARRAELKGSRIKLVYDFSSEEQLRDFEKGLGPGSAVKRDDGVLVLRGECRLFAGEPFEKSLTVRGKSPAGGFDPSAPNIAVGLFVREKQRLRSEGGPMSLFMLLGASGGPEPRDYVVFAVGYKTAVADYGGKRLESLYVSGQTDPIPLPAHAVLFGRRGKPLHTDARECLWAVKAAPIGGALSFEATASLDRLEWKLNGKTLVENGPSLERWADGLERIGSIALLTHAAEARLSLLEVEGDLRDAWLAERLKGEALRAFRAYDPDA